MVLALTITLMLITRNLLLITRTWMLNIAKRFISLFQICRFNLVSQSVCNGFFM